MSTWNAAAEPSTEPAGAGNAARAMRVALFVPCLVDTFTPRVAVAMVRVLRRLGCRVTYPAEQTCCGQPAFNSGFLTEAACLGRRMMRVFDGCQYVVTSSGSCAAMVREHLVELLDEGPSREQARRLASSTCEIGSFLRDVLRLAPERCRGLIREPVTYHYSCHLRGAETPETASAMVRAMAGPCYRELDDIDECCGFGGVFCVNHPDISCAMADQKLAAIRRTGARLVVCNEAGCGLHLEGVARRAGMRLRFAHLIELLAEGWGLLEHRP